MKKGIALISGLLFLLICISTVFLVPRFGFTIEQTSNPLKYSHSVKYDSGKSYYYSCPYETLNIHVNNDKSIKVDYLMTYNGIDKSEKFEFTFAKGDMFLKEGKWVFYSDATSGISSREYIIKTEIEKNDRYHFLYIRIAIIAVLSLVATILLYKSDFNININKLHIKNKVAFFTSLLVYLFSFLIALRILI